MKKRTWIIVGATSVIAEHFAHIAAQQGCQLRLIGRQEESLSLIAKDIQIRYDIPCTVIVQDLAVPQMNFESIFSGSDEEEFDLFLAHSDVTDNANLDNQTIERLIQINITSTAQLVHTYLRVAQSRHQLIYLSSVAACRGRMKNSLYGGSKAALEIYLQGLQQAASEHQTILICRLGFIDTRQTFGLPGIFYAAPPEHCALACWQACQKKRRMIYFPFFWRFIMTIIRSLPFVLYKHIKR
jgi:short-subunit dehydrogenase